MGQKVFLLPPCRGDYMDWDLYQSVLKIILLNSRCTAIHEEYSVPNTSLQSYLYLMFPALRCSSLKHLWYLINLGEMNNKSVIKKITEKVFKNK